MLVKTNFQLGSLLLGLLLVVGCASAPRSKTPTSAVALKSANVFRFSDIPVPSGFQIMPENSYSFESSGVRVAVLKYQGKADPYSVINFYKDQMPMYNWSLLNIVEFGSSLLNFEREGETCIIDLESKGNSLTITISLGPKSKAISKSRIQETRTKKSVK